MDIQRVLILLGLAVTSYMLILAWNEDYFQGSSDTVDDPVVLDDAPLVGAGVVVQAGDTAAEGHGVGRCSGEGEEGGVRGSGHTPAPVAA